MDDSEFLAGIERRIEQSAGEPVHVELDHDNPQGMSVELSDPPRIVVGADALNYPGLARTFIQYAILCLRERRTIEEEEFRRFLRRN